MSPEIVLRIKNNVRLDMYLPYVMVSSWGRSGSNLTNDMPGGHAALTSSKATWQGYCWYVRKCQI